MNYEIVIVRSAFKQLQQLPKPLQEKVTSKIELLAANPRPHGCEKLTNRTNEYRVRVADYRIVYSIFDTKLVVEIVDIDHRRQVYKK